MSDSACCMAHLGFDMSDKFMEAANIRVSETVQVGLVPDARPELKALNKYLRHFRVRLICLKHQPEKPAA